GPGHKPLRHPRPAAPSVLRACRYRARSARTPRTAFSAAPSSAESPNRPPIIAPSIASTLILFFLPIAALAGRHVRAHPARGAYKHSVKESGCSSRGLRFRAGMCQGPYTTVEGRPDRRKARARAPAPRAVGTRRPHLRLLETQG